MTNTLQSFVARSQRNEHKKYRKNPVLRLIWDSVFKQLLAKYPGINAAPPLRPRGSRHSFGPRGVVLLGDDPASRLAGPLRRIGRWLVSAQSEVSGNHEHDHYETHNPDNIVHFALTVVLRSRINILIPTIGLCHIYCTLSARRTRPPNATSGPVRHLPATSKILRLHNRNEDNQIEAHFDGETTVVRLYLFAPERSCHHGQNEKRKR